MNLHRLVFREILHRKLSFSLGVISASVAVACLVAALAILQKHDARTEQIIAAKEAETRQQMAKLEDDYRKLMLKMGFNVLILPKEQNLSDLYADDFASKYMPEEYATRLAKSRVATINHVLPSLQQKVKWPERERTVLLMGVRGEVYIQSKQQKPLLEPVAPGTMILGHELARNLALKAGDQTKFMGREFTVAKVNAERGNKDDITVWISLPEAQELLGKPGLINGILALDCTCDTVDRLGRIRPEIARILPDTQVIEYASQALTRAEARQRAAAEAQASIQREKEGRDKLRARTRSLGGRAGPGGDGRQRRLDRSARAGQRPRPARRDRHPARARAAFAPDPADLSRQGGGHRAGRRVSGLRCSGARSARCGAKRRARRRSIWPSLIRGCCCWCWSPRPCWRRWPVGCRRSAPRSRTRRRC